MTKRFVTLFLALLLVSSLSMFGQEKSLRTKAPLKIDQTTKVDSWAPGTDVPVTAANYVAVDTMHNSFGPSTPTINPISYDPVSGVLALVHRGNGRTYAEGSGELWWNYSTDMGVTWPRSTTSVQNGQTSQIFARYPSMTIKNEFGSTNLADLWGAFAWPELGPTGANFGNMGWGVTIGLEISEFAELDFDPPNYSSNVPTFTDGQYIYWVSDNGDDNSIRFFRTVDYSNVEKIDPPTWAASVFSTGNITMGGVAYNGVLYTAVQATFDTVVGLGGWEPGYCKSTDQGTTWSDWFIIDWHDFPAFESYEELWDWRKDDGFVSYAGDIEVDKNGMVHLLFGLTDLADSADEEGYNAIVEFFETSEGVWDYNILAEGFEDVNDLSLYEAPDISGSGSGDDPAVGQCGPSFFLATNADRDFFVAQYNIAIYEAGTDSIPCEMFYQTRALDDAEWSLRTNLTETAEMNEDGGHLAPFLATVDDGAGTITDYAFSGFWYEAGNTTRYVDPRNEHVFYIAAVPVRTTTGVEGDVNTVMNYSLLQNYPNPFNPSTKIDFTIPSNEYVTLKIYDILGNEVASLVSEERNAGLNSVVFDASNLASGMYVYKINAGQFTSSKKMMLLK